MADPVAEPKRPVTDRGRRTRSRLVDSAREVFEEHGFLDARITDIAERAGVAYGTFYTYFDSKEAIFDEVARQVQRDFLFSSDGRDEDGRLPLGLYERIERANRRYLEGYARNARIMAVMEQVATFNDELLEIRKEMRVAFVERSTRAIQRWQADGLADVALDPCYAASALGSMVDRFAYVWLVLGGDFELDKAVANLTRLWVQALALSCEPPTAPTAPAAPTRSRRASGGRRRGDVPGLRRGGS